MISHNPSLHLGLPIKTNLPHVSLPIKIFDAFFVCLAALHLLYILTNSSNDDSSIHESFQERKWNVSAVNGRVGHPTGQWGEEENRCKSTQCSPALCDVRADINTRVVHQKHLRPEKTGGYLHVIGTSTSRVRLPGSSSSWLAGLSAYFFYTHTRKKKCRTPPDEMKIDLTVRKSQRLTHFSSFLTRSHMNTHRNGSNGFLVRHRPHFGIS